MCRTSWSTRTACTILLLALLPASPAAAQDTVAQPFTTAHGLPSDQIVAVAQTSDGWLWVGTTEGLRQFFGSRFREADVPAHLLREQIGALLATPDGTLWIGAASHLHRRMPDAEWETYLDEEAGLEVGPIRALHQADDGTLLVGGFNGLARWRPGGSEAITIDGSPLAVSALTEDSQGHLWAAALAPEGRVIQVFRGDGLVETIDSGDGLPKGLEISAILRDSQNQMWAATDAGLVRFLDFSVSDILTQSDGLLSSRVSALVEHREGGLWAGTAGGLNHVRHGSVAASFTSQVTRAGDSVNALSYDREGNLWLGTSGGVSRLPVGRWFTESQAPLQLTEIREVLPGGADDSYVVTRDGTLYTTVHGHWTQSDKGVSGQQVVHALVRAVDGTIWAGTNDGLARLRAGRFQVGTRLPVGLRGQAILFDRQFGLWVGTNRGLYRGPPAGDPSLSKVDQLGEDSVLCLWETDEGDIWAGTSNSGALRYRDGTWTIVDGATTGHGLVDDAVVAGLEDSAANLWFATPDGVSRLRSGADPLDPDGWRTFRTPDLAGEQATALWEDKDHPGHIWIGTGGGLNLIRGEGPVSAFTREDGLGHRWITALGQAPDGTLWIGTASGLTYHRDAGQAPKIELGPFLVDNEECDADCRAAGVPYRSRTAAFQYGGSDLGDLDGLQYLVSIQAGRDFTQVYTRTRSLVQDLKPGTEYRFAVRAFDRHFNGSDTVSLTLPVDAPTLWERVRDETYLLILFILGVILLALLLAFYVQRQVRRRQFFRFTNLLEVTLSSMEEDARLHSLLEGRVRRPGRLSKLLGRLNVPPELLMSLMRRPEDLAVAGAGTPDFDRIHRLEAELREHRADAPGTLQDLGGLLYSTLFPDPIPLELRQLDLGHRTRSARMRLHLEEAPHLKALPWEFIHDPEQPGYLAIDSQVTLVREVMTDDDHDDMQGLAITAPLRVLVALANPDDPGLSKLTRQDEEYAAIERALAPLVEAGKVHLTPLPHALWDTFEAAVREGGFDLIHFTGHGGIWQGQGLPVLYFESEQSTPVRVPQKHLVDLFLSASTSEQRRPRLVVLNACRSAEDDVIQGTLGMAEALVRVARLPAAIGMGYEISEDAAVAFCEAFYTTLVVHGQVDHAVMEARRALSSKFGPGRLHWGAPRLYSRTPEGVLFNLVKLG